MKNKIIIIVSILMSVVSLTASIIFVSQYKDWSGIGGESCIKPKISSIDKDHDGIDDQTDMYQSAMNYVNTKPVYKSAYYASGYPNDKYGVCTDVIAFAMRDSGYDLQELMYRDILAHPKEYNIERVDRKIDFRRVPNLIVYFKHNGIKLTNDVSKVEEWQPGDILITEGHCGIISAKRNSKGIPYVIHQSPSARYVEDFLERAQKKIVGHYRLTN